MDVSEQDPALGHQRADHQAVQVYGLHAQAVQDGYPGAVARQKAEARLRDEETIAAGRASPRQVQRRNAMTGLRRAKFPLKGLPGKR